MDEIDVSELKSTAAQALLLKCLHDNTRPVGMGFMQAREVTYDDCMVIVSGLNRRFEFDYFYGRPLKVFLKEVPGASGKFDDYTLVLYGAWLYDRDAPGGKGSCQRAVDQAKREWAEMCAKGDAK